jgi:pimeloyl-ACP methyl ester carboxylesterase
MSTLIALIVIAAVVILIVILGLVVFTARTARKVEAALPPRGKFMQVGSERIHYVDRGGAGPAIVMIHGLGGNLMHFTYALADELTGDFRVIIVDRPACGYSERPEGAPADLKAQAATLAKFMRALGLKQPLVVGHSLGGALSLAIALDHPDCAGALALIAPLTHVPDNVPDVLKGLIIHSPALRKVNAWTLATPLGIRRGAAALEEVFAPEPAPADFPIRAGGLLGLRPKAFCAASSDAVLAEYVLPNYVARYASLALPMGMLFGKGDRLLDYHAQGEAMKVVCPALDLELMEGGHMLPMTAPDRCAALIRRVAARQQEVAGVA